MTQKIMKVQLLGSHGYYLTKLEEGMSITGLAKKVNIGVAHCFHITKSLEEAGIIEKRAKGRIVQLYLTKLGRELYELSLELFNKESLLKRGTYKFTGFETDPEIH